MFHRSRTTRRKFLAASAHVSAAAAAAPYFVPASVLGQGGRVPPSDRIVLECIGVGGQGRGNMARFMQFDDVQVVAACDVDKRHLDQAVHMVNSRYGNNDCAHYHDFRDLLARDDIDAVSIATPDHWHALTSVAAATAGKDIYCEKPLANSVAEGRAICRAVEAHGRVLQTGSHERSADGARLAAELVRNGRIGRIHTVRVNLPCSDDHHKQARALKRIPPAMPVPDELDWDFWLGHAPMVPYHEKRCHFWWRFILAYGGGEMTDRGAHVIDIAQLALGMDDTGPVEFAARGVQEGGSLYDVFWDYEFENTYANGVRLLGSTQEPRGLKFEGSDGWIFLHIHGSNLEASSPDILHEQIGDAEIQLGRSPGHHRNFLDCVKSRRQPFASAEIGHRTASICHLNNIAMYLGRKLQWDPSGEVVVNDADAKSLLTPTMRAPWSL